MTNLFFFSKVNYLLLTENLHLRDWLTIILKTILDMSTLRVNQKVLEWIIQMGGIGMENLVKVNGMELLSWSINMEIITLENTEI